MLGLRYVACDECGTVAATPATPTACKRCGSTALTDLTDRFREPAYFADVD
jgi:RNA polymerase subunit RPABC4/transcription elongation factor Spt4